MDPSRLAMALWGNGYAPENDAISFARQKDREGARGELAQALAGTWPVQMAKSAVGAAALPGDVYAGRVDPMSQQGIERAADLAGFTTLGSFAAPRPAGSLGMGGMPEKPGIRAYHGSPHDFDKFDLSKIGTGEGAQAYGHGLYFADNEVVAKGYRDALKPGKGVGPEDTAARLLDASGGNRDAALAEMRRRIADANARGVPYDQVKQLMEARNIINTQPEKATGRMYEVNIRANPDDFLDWDKPLAQQPETVSKALDQVVKSRDRMPKEWIDASPGAEQRMREVGIPGIKYLDQGSRAAGDGSRNYVVFDDKLIEILRKYGLTGLLGLGAAGGAYQSQTQEGGT